MWKIEECISDFLELVEKVLSDCPLFVILNSYTTGLQASVMSYLLSLKLKNKRGGNVLADEIGLKVEASGLIMPAGASSRWINV